jgi:hypothetical protein
MANTFLTPQVIARAALATLYETCVMAQLVHRDLDEDFAGKVGDTVNVRKPATFDAYEYDRSQGIQIQNATETAIPVTLNHFADVSFAVTAEEMTLEIQDFATQLLNPAMEAISQKIDRDLLALRDDIVQEVGNGGLPNIHNWDTPKAMIDADRVLNERNVSPSQRSVVIGPQMKAHWLSDPLFHQLDVRGDTDGLREASLGRRVRVRRVQHPEHQGAAADDRQQQERSRGRVPQDRVLPGHPPLGFAARRGQRRGGELQGLLTEGRARLRHRPQAGRLLDRHALRHQDLGRQPGRAGQGRGQRPTASSR